MREVSVAVLVLVVLVLYILLVSGDNGVFFEEPSPAVVAENEVAVFRCRVSSGAQAWGLNGTFTSTLLNTDFEEHSEAASDGSPRVNTLSIVAQIVYNGTTVQCFVHGLPNSNDLNSSTTLLIQGPLAAVTDLTAEPGTDSILFLWVAPFSLNLTNNNTDIEPDFTYCVDIYHSTDNGTEMMVTEHGVTETSYSFTANEMGPCDLFTGVVTPVNGAGNGRGSGPVNVTFVDAPVVRQAVVSVEVEFIYDEDGTLTTVVISVDFMAIVYICTCDVLIITNDGRDPTNGTMIELVENTGQRTFTFPFDDFVPDRIWLMDIVLENSAGSTTTRHMHLSTHDVQDITTLSGSPSGMEFNVKFAINSRALGCVVIVKSDSMEAVFVKYRDIDSTSDQFTVTSLPPASYDMAGFDLEGSSTLPGRYTAVNARLESSESGPQPLGVEGGVIAEAVLTTPIDGTVYVNCSIPAGINATECVFIIHPPGSLEEIETVVVMNGEEHYIPISSSMEYSVTSFGRLDRRIVSLSNDLSPSETGRSVSPLVGAVIGVVLVLIIIVAVLAGLVLCRRRVKRVRGVTLPDTEKPTAPNKDTRPAAPLLVQAPAGGPPPPPIPLHCTSDDESNPAYATITSTSLSYLQGSAHDITSQNAMPINAARGPLPQESENRIANDGGSPRPYPFVGSVDLLPEPTNQEPLYDTPDKKKSGTGSVYANTVPDKSIKAPPVQDTEVPYAQPAGYKSDGKLYSILQHKPRKEKTNKPKDDLTVIYRPIDHIATAANAKPLQPAPPVATSAPAVLPLLTINLLCDALYEIRGAWKALAEQLKQDDDLIDEIDTNNERDEACLQQVLEFWFENNDFQHTWSEVVTALEGIGQQALADYIRSTHVLPEKERLPGTPVHEHSKLVSLPPSSLQPSHHDPVLHGSFARSQSPAPTPISKRWSVPLQEFKDVLKTELVAPEPQQSMSLSNVGVKDEATRLSVTANRVSENGCETDSVAYPQNFAENAGSEDKPSNVFPTQETQQDHTANLALASEDNREFMEVYKVVQHSTAFWIVE